MSVDVGWDAGSRWVVLKADLLRWTTLMSGYQRLKPIWKLLEGNVRVNAECLVVKSIAKMNRDAAGSVRPLELAEDADEILLVLWGDEVLLPEDAVWLDGQLLHPGEYSVWPWIRAASLLSTARREVLGTRQGRLERQDRFIIASADQKLACSSVPEPFHPRCRGNPLTIPSLVGASYIGWQVDHSCIIETILMLHG